MKLQTGAIRIAEIFETAWRLVEKVAGDPPRRIETGLCLAVGTLVCLLVATLAARALRAGKVSKIRALLVT
ncbi:MAG: hypothetical protein N2255_00700, partial [Kiritimatiellae bacterium]|nr:hypothetical protein [Kiritimatiellia bacterium]